MESTQAIPLPSFGSTSSTSYVIPKLRVSRWSTGGQKSTASASGSTTVPVNPHDENGFSEGEQGLNGGERQPLYPLSSEGEVVSEVEGDVVHEEPALRL